MVGRVWADGGAGPSPADRAEAEADAALWGLVLPPPQEPEPVEVWEDHRAGLEAFLAVAGQWRTASIGAHGVTQVIYLGIEAHGAEAALRLAGLSVTPVTWGQVRVIAAAACEALNGR